MYTVQILFAQSLDLYGGNIVSDYLFRFLTPNSNQPEIHVQQDDSSLPTSAKPERLANKLHLPKTLCKERHQSVYEILLQNVREHD